MLAILMTGLLGASLWASLVGWGIPQPLKQPISIREASARQQTGAGSRVRYFIGGGLRGGK